MYQRGKNLITKGIWLITLLAAFVMLTPDVSYAGNTGGNLGCSGGGVAGGSLFDTTNNGLCEHDGDYLEHLFSSTICMYVKIIDNILSKIYCGIQEAIKDELALVIILYIAIFGVQILTGQTQLAGGEIVARCVKICFVWLFATNASYGIGVGFTFFLGLLNEGVGWVVAVIIPGGATDPMSTYEKIDELIYEAITGPFTAANSKVVGLFLVMAIAFFPIFIMGVVFLAQTGLLLVSCVVIFLLSISAIAFLISLSPLFLSFMLFQSTFYLFENWLRYMISYCMQVIVIFAIVAMWIQITQQFIGFFNDLSDLVFEYQELLQPANTYQPTTTWAVCPMSFGVNNMGPTAQCAGSFNPGVSSPDLIPPSRMAEIKGFLYYVIFHMTTLIVIAYAFRVLLKNASQIARDLVGPAYVPMLGKGFGAEALGEPTGYPKRQHMRSMGGADAAPRKR